MSAEKPSVFHDVRMRGFRERAEVDDVLALLKARLSPLPAEDVGLHEAAGRVLENSRHAARQRASGGSNRTDRNQRHVFRGFGVATKHLFQSRQHSCAEPLPNRFGGGKSKRAIAKKCR